MARGTNDAAIELRLLRKDGTTPGAEPMGYESLAGEARTVMGDEEAPFLKAPPFVQDEQGIWGDEISSAFAPSTPIDVAQKRSLALYLEYVPPAGVTAATLRLVLESDPDGEGVFFPVSVVDATINPIATTIVAFRDAYASEIRFPSVPAGTYRTVIPFDVSAYDTVRFRFAETTDGDSAELNANYTLSE